MTEIKILELMDAIQQTQKTADDMWRVLREVLEEQRNAQQSVHLTAEPSGKIETNIDEDALHQWVYGTTRRK